MDENQIRIVENMIKAALSKAMDFPTRKKGDTPTDSYQLTPQKYVDMSGPISQRPRASVANAGQQYFSTTDGYPVFFNPNSSVWVSGTGSVVAGG